MIRKLSYALAAGCGIGGASLAWGWTEARLFAVRRYQIPVLPAGQAPLRVLHISDIHLLARQGRKQRFIAGLADLEPDLIVNTGDNIAEPDAIDPLMRSFGELRDVPGVFVFGSNDYHRATFRNPFSYLSRSDPYRLKRRAEVAATLPSELLRDQMKSAGWIDLTHIRTQLTVSGRKLAFRGTDDAHIGRADYSLVAGPPDPAADLNIGVTHAPYLEMLDQMTGDGLDLIFAGHTHGGQVCMPFKGAIITNCDLDRARAKGISTHTCGGHTATLSVSAGLGTSPFAPYRIACRPEVSLITLTARTEMPDASDAAS